MNDTQRDRLTFFFEVINSNIKFRSIFFRPNTLKLFQLETIPHQPQSFYLCLLREGY